MIVFHIELRVSFGMADLLDSGHCEAHAIMDRVAELAAVVRLAVLSSGRYCMVDRQLPAAAASKRVSGSRFVYPEECGGLGLWSSAEGGP